MIVRIYLSTGQVYDLDANSIQDSIDNGYGDYVDGEYVLHKLNYEAMTETPPNYERIYRFSKCPFMAGFIKWCDVHQWYYARSLANEAISEGCITQDDYDFVDGILPPNPS